MTACAVPVSTLSSWSETAGFTTEVTARHTERVQAASDRLATPARGMRRMKMKGDRSERLKALMPCQRGNRCVTCEKYWHCTSLVRRRRYDREGLCQYCGLKIDVPGRIVAQTGQYRLYKMCSFCRKKVALRRREKLNRD